MKYMRYSTIFGAIAGGIGGGLFGNWSAECENDNPRNRFSLSATQKTVNKVTYTAGGIAAGAFFGLLAGPSIPPYLVLLGGYHILDHLEHP